MRKQILFISMIFFTLMNVSHAQNHTSTGNIPKTFAESFSALCDTLYLKGQTDAAKYYDDYNMAGTGTLAISLLNPVAGLIPAFVCSSTNPKEKNLNFHNSSLFQNPDYRNGYTHAAKKIKQRKVWTNWAVGFGVNLIAGVIILSN